MSQMFPQIDVVHGDVLTHQADVLLLKFAQNLYGVDAKVVQRLVLAGTILDGRLPGIGETLLTSSRQVVGARELLFVGVVPLGLFDYQSIREFSSRALSVLGTRRPDVEVVATTLHGTGFGLDEAEAFRAEFAGVLDAIEEGTAPKRLRQISIIERDADTAARLQALLASMMSTVDRNPGLETFAPSPRAIGDIRGDLQSVGADSLAKPHVFVAMPFADEYFDRFHYGIKGAVNSAGYLCERADLASFTGDVLSWVKERIDKAALVVADLTQANPNVYLEVGYAWGRGVNTVLLVAEGDELKFDVRTQRCLVFRNIRHLEELLTDELRALSLRPRAGQ